MRSGEPSGQRGCGKESAKGMCWERRLTLCRPRKNHCRVLDKEDNLTGTCEKITLAGGPHAFKGKVSGGEGQEERRRGTAEEGRQLGCHPIISAKQMVA